MREIRFAAMGTDAHVIVLGGRRGLPDEARRAIDVLEHRWSRFLPDSEISRLNAHAGDPAVVSPETFDLIALACEGRRRSGGAFDPLLLPDLVAAGYDRSFEQLATEPALPRTPVRHVGTDGIVLDREARLVQVPEGAAFDPGGIGKGLAADMVVEMLLGEGARGALVNIGGDLRAAGASPDDEGWLVEVEDPRDGTVIARLALSDGAVATTSSLKRAWSRGGVDGHHLIDPHTREPARVGIVAVTALASQGWLAEVAAKAAFLADGEALGALRVLGATGLVVRADGSIAVDDDLWRFLP